MRVRPVLMRPNRRDKTMDILVKLIVCMVFLGEGVVSWLYLTGRRAQDVRSPSTNQVGMVLNIVLFLGVLIWL